MMELIGLIGRMQAAVVMQKDRDTVPEWMEIRGLTITAFGLDFIEADLVWRDRRGILISMGCEIRPLPRKMIFNKDSWEVGFENLIKQLVRGYEMTWPVTAEYFIKHTPASFCKTPGWENWG